MTSPFLGAWLLVSQDTVYPDGSSVPSRGEHPAGIIMYDASGYMAVQLMRTDEHARDYTDLTSFRTAMDGYHAYFGRYEVDEAAQIVRHFVEGSGYFEYRGTTQVRHYHFEGDTLTLQAQADDGTRRVLVWRRATAQQT
jgi:hypothetical protein